MKYISILFAVLVLAGCSSVKDPGDIYVDHPEAFGRERLVNHRLQEKQWLEKQLNENPGSTDSGRRVLSGIDKLREQRAYREEVSRLIHEIELVDTHDVTGHSLSTLKFDLSTLRKLHRPWYRKLGRARAHDLYAKAEMIVAPPTDDYSNITPDFMANWASTIQKTLNRTIHSTFLGIQNGDILAEDHGLDLTAELLFIESNEENDGTDEQLLFKFMEQDSPRELSKPKNLKVAFTASIAKKYKRAFNDYFEISLTPFGSDLDKIYYRVIPKPGSHTNLISDLDQIKHRTFISTVESKERHLVTGYVRNDQEFGWALGPGIELPEIHNNDRIEKLTYANIPVQHTVQASLVHPAWWDSIQVIWDTWWENGYVDKYKRMNPPVIKQTRKNSPDFRQTYDELMMYKQKKAQIDKQLETITSELNQAQYKYSTYSSMLLPVRTSSTMSTQVEGFRTASEDLKTQVQNLEDKIAALKKETGAIKSKTAGKDEQLGQLYAALDESNKQVKKVEDEIAALKKETGQLESKTAGKDEQLGQLYAASRDLKTQVQDAEDKIAALKKDIGAIKRKTAGKDEQLSLLKAALDDSNNQVKKVEDEIAALEKETGQLESKTAGKAEQLGQLYAASRDLKTQVQDAEDEIAALKKDIGAIKRKTAGKAEQLGLLKIALDEPNDHVQKAADGLAALEKEIGWLENETADQDKKLGQLYAASRDLKTQVQDAEDELAALEKEAGAIKRKTADKNEQLGLLYAASRDLKTQVQTTEDGIAVLKNETGPLESKTADMSDQLRNLRAKSADAEKPVIMLEDEIAVLKNETGQLESKTADKSAQLITLRANSTEMEKPVILLEDEIAALKQETGRLESETAGKSTQLGQLNAALDDSNKQVQKLEDEIAVLKKEIGPLKSIVKKEKWQPDIKQITNPDVLGGTVSNLENVIEEKKKQEKGLVKTGKQYEQYMKELQDWIDPHSITVKISPDYTALTQFFMDQKKSDGRNPVAGDILFRDQGSRLHVGRIP